MSEQEKLLPCGCGGERRTYDCGETGKGYVECDCGMEIWARNKPEARKAWNRAMTRPQPAIEGDVVERVEVAVAEEYLCIPKGTTWEDASERLAKAALTAIDYDREQVRREALEEVAKVCEGYFQTGAAMAEGIRKLIERGGGDA